MKGLYVALVRAARRVLVSCKLMPQLDRLARRSRTALWVRSWFAIYDLDDMLEVGLPWWTFKSIDAVEAHLARRPGSRVFEWGSGVSTVWLAARVGEVIAVEHDLTWAELMVPHLPGNARVVAKRPLVLQNPTTVSAKPGFRGQDFSDYVAAIDSVSGQFDVIVIDGRAREACLLRALERLTPAGLIVFDNVDRQRYRDSVEALGDQVEVVWTKGRTPALPYPTRTALIRVREPRVP